MKNNIAIFWKIISFDRVILFHAVTLVVMQVIAAVSEIFLVTLVVSSFSQENQNFFHVSETELPVYLVLTLLSMLFSKFLMIKLTANVSFGAIGMLSPFIFRKLLNVPMLNTKNSLEEKFTFLSSKIELVVHHLLLPMIHIILSAILLVMFLGYIASKEPQLLIAVIIIITLGYIFPSVVLRNKIRSNARAINAGLSKNISLIRAGIFQVKEVTTWGLRDYFTREQQATVTRTYASKGNSYEISMHPRTIIEVVIYSAFILAFIFYVEMGNNASIDIASLTTSMFLILKALPYMQQVYYSITHIRTGAEIVKEFDNYFNHEFVDKKKLDIETTAPLSIELCGISKTLDGQNLFRDIRYRITDNSKVAILGPSGSGKSTLLEIIMGFMKPTDGYVLFKGINNRDFDFSELIAYVPQEPFLFDDTVIENITFSRYRNEATDDELLDEAISLAGLSTLLEENPDFLLRRTGENGQNLSGGQAQRVALARALYSQRKILILDEFTSALDTSTAVEVVGNLMRLNIIIIAVTHDTLVAEQFQDRIDITCWK